MTNASPTFGAIGPSHVDPRSGEILDADIGIESLSSRSIRAAARAGPDRRRRRQPVRARRRYARRSTRLLLPGASARYDDEAAEQMALRARRARGARRPRPDSPEAEKFVQAYLKDVTMHEVGPHARPAPQLPLVARLHPGAARRPGVHQGNGITGSVMDYAPINLNGADEPRARYGTPFSDTLGPYDYWAIEYAYRPLPAGLTRSRGERRAGEDRRPQRRAAARLRHRRGQLPRHRSRVAAVRPRQRRHRLRQEADRDRPGPAEAPGDAPRSGPTRTTTCCRRSVSYAIRDVARAANVLSRQIGGVRTVRDAPGTGRDPLSPVPVAEQREALDVITGSLLVGRQPARLAGAAAQARHRLQRALRGAARRRRLDRRPTTRPPARCSACSARCSRC